MYWDPTDPRKCLAPKLERYRRLGVRELVCFDPESEPPRLRVWGAVDGDLVERRVDDLTAQSQCLPGCWTVITEHPTFGRQLRLRRLEGELFPTPEEREREAKKLALPAAEREREVAERERRVAERERQVAEHERELRAAAEARVRELEAQLRRRDGG